MFGPTLSFVTFEDVNMKRQQIVLMLLMFLSLEASLNQGKALSKSLVLFTPQPSVKLAIAPLFIPWKFNETGVGHAVIEVKINARGNVTSAKSVEGSADFPWGDLSYIDAAKLWQFDPSENDAAERTVRIKFVQKIVPKGASWQELAPRYVAPYQMEISHEVFKSNIHEDPPVSSEKKGKS